MLEVAMVIAVFRLQSITRVNCVQLVVRYNPMDSAARLPTVMTTISVRPVYWKVPNAQCMTISRDVTLGTALFIILARTTVVESVAQIWRVVRQAGLTMARRVQGYSLTRQPVMMDIITKRRLIFVI
jgi:hypothetical protein